MIAVPVLVRQILAVVPKEIEMIFTPGDGRQLPGFHVKNVWSFGRNILRNSYGLLLLIGFAEARLHLHRRLAMAPRGEGAW